ncbi:hypothetical protein SH528x_001247 [Novipirellula sp. SH528]|uniref:hypothetical protein n=1 Tax=Novipirellula sp. SH528 TaxID=3454466 RepID=UPI003FA15183
MNVDLWQSVDTYLRANDIDGAASHLETLVRSENSDRFTSLADSAFTNPATSVLEHVNTFLSACAPQFDLRAAYHEMNGFDINYDRWYFDSFGYADLTDDPDDVDWLCDWNSPDWETFTLTGLEQTQDDFRWYMENKVWEKKTHETAKEIAVLLVMVRFLQLVQSALSSGSLAASVPILATVHDFDMFGRFQP